MLRPIGITLLASIWIATVARGQCADWSAFKIPGMNAAVSSAVSCDLGAGPMLLAGGAFLRASSASIANLARWDGTNWVPFGAPVNGSVETFRVRQENGANVLYVGGGFTTIGGISANGIARFDGATWSTFGTGVVGDVNAIEFYDDGSGPQLFVGGYFSSAGGVSTPNIARWTGTTWAGIGGVTGIGTGFVNALCAFDDGGGTKLWVGGHFGFTGGMPNANIATWNGASWVSAGGANGAVHDLATFDDGSGPALAAAGTFTSIGGVASAPVARRANGAWSAMGSSASPQAQALTVLVRPGFGPGGFDDLVVAGRFSAFDGVPAENVARWNGAGWSALGTGAKEYIRALAQHDDGTGSRLVACGTAPITTAEYTGYVAILDGGVWRSLDRGAASVIASIEAFETFDDGSGPVLYAGGYFHYLGNAIGNGIARFDGTEWSALGSIHPIYVHALRAHDDGSGSKLYAGGDFSVIGGITANGIARFDGSGWERLEASPPIVFPGEFRVRALAEFDDGTGLALYVGGSFTHPTAGAQRILRWRNSTWSTVGTGLDDTVQGLEVHDDGSGPALYACGDFQFVGATSANRVARWDGAQWHGLGDGIGGAVPNPAVYALESRIDADGPALYAGGKFSMAGASPASNLARWKGGAWSEVGGGVSGTVFALTSNDDGTGDGDELYLAGEITHAGGVAVDRIARWNGTNFTPLGGGVNGGRVYALHAWDDGSGRDLYVGGTFPTIEGGVSSGSFARIEACGETGRTYCYGDGSGTACPCGNASAVGARAGCSNSLGLAGSLRARGESSLTGDTLALDGAGMPNSSTLYFQGSSLANGGLGTVFGDGIRCSGGPFVRLGSKLNVAGASSYPEVGDLAISVRGLLTGPGIRRYESRYRNSAAFCTPDTFNYTNGVEITWRP